MTGSYTLPYKQEKELSRCEIAPFLYAIVTDYSSAIASEGQTPAQVPQLMHLSASIT